MADRVVIVGTSRSKKGIPASEIRQMMGRGGRKHGSGAYHVDVIVDEDINIEIADEIESQSSFQVKSSLGSLEETALNMLPEINDGSVNNGDSAKEWMMSTLHYAQTSETHDPSDLFNTLKEWGAIVEVGKKIMPTDICKASVASYLHPMDIKMWSENLDTLVGFGFINNDLAISWAFANCYKNKASGYMGEGYQNLLDKVRFSLPQELDYTSLQVGIATWWNVFGGPPIGNMKGVALGFKGDFPRISRAIKIARSDLSDLMDQLAVRARRGFPSKLSFLIGLENVSKSLACNIYDQGITSISDLNENLDNLHLDDDGDEDYRLREILRKALLGAELKGMIKE